MPEAEFCLLFLRPLNRLKIRYVVSGSVASILYGEPRLTNDVDMLVFFRADDIARLQEAFPSPEFYVPPVEVILAEMARPQHGQFNLIHADSGFKADLYPAGQDEFNAWAFRRARQMDYFGVPVTVAPPEYVIVRKLEYFREGGSDKHLRDIRGMLNVSGEIIDRAVLREWVQRKGVEEQWNLVQQK